MKIKRNIIVRTRALVVSMLLACSLVSCNDFLDVTDYFDDMTQLDSVFNRQELLYKYILGIANHLPNEGELWTSSFAPFQGASDENFTSWKDNRHAGLRFQLDEITPRDEFYNNWPGYYTGIRKANTVLARIDEVQDISTVERRYYMGRCYFLRGYFYYLLLRQYGPVPIMPEQSFKVDDAIEDMSFERNTYDECVEYICENMEKAMDYLPAENVSTAERFFPTKGAAMAVVSRLRLYAASPWYNGNTFYSDWKTTDGRHFISQTPDNSRWGKAAAAAKRIMDTGQYMIFTTPKEVDTQDLPENVSSANFPAGAGNIDPYRSYTYLFNGELMVEVNPEFIYSCAPNNKKDYSALWIAAVHTVDGGNGLNLTQDLIDAFRMKDGYPIDQSSAEHPYPQEDWYEPIGGSGYTFSGYQVRPNTARMYDNREPRFYATVGYCHNLWPGTGYTGSDNSLRNIEVTYYSNGTAAVNPSHPLDFNHTGYTCKKYIHLEDNLKGTVKVKYFPIFRYAEILLNYAEALNELEGSYTDEVTGLTVSREIGEIVAAINPIRYRGGLPGLDPADPTLTVEKVRELIKLERQIEFACEGHRYHDLRRWGKDAMEAYNRPVRGMNIQASSNQRQLFYTPVIISNDLTRRYFSYKHYFYPIPKTVLDKNKKLVQNPEW